MKIWKQFEFFTIITVIVKSKREFNSEQGKRLFCSKVKYATTKNCVMQIISGVNSR